MNTRFYEITRIPDLTLSRYSALDENGVDGVIKKQLVFLRQIYREALLANETIHWIYEYNPEAGKGKRLRIFLKFDSDSLSSYADIFVKNSPLAPYFDITASSYGELTEATFEYMAVLIKREKISRADRSENGYFYSVNKWKMNENARLFNLFTMMKNINQPCIYCVDASAADFTNAIESPDMLGNAMSALREMLALRLDKHNIGSLLQKDEHADYTLNSYKNLVNDLSANPHFLANIRVYAHSSEYASMLLDAAASEALDEGSHDIKLNHGAFNIKTVTESQVSPFCDRKTPDELTFLSTLFMMKELAPFIALPALYSGESIEIPKETAPSYDDNGLYLGEDNDGYSVYIPLENLPKHAFLSGVPGSGKTNSMLHMATELYRKNIPFLILEPAKQEYRALVNRADMKGITVFSPSSGTNFPLHINPFEFPTKMSLSEHISNLLDVFDGAFYMIPPMPFLLGQALERVYKDKGWLHYMINDGTMPYPTMSELYKTLERILDETTYSDENKSNMKSVLQVRIGSLLSREMGDVFDVPFSTVAPEQWLKRSVIIELESMGSGPANFLTLMLSALIRESLKVNPMTRQESVKQPVRHVIFFEEAHNLIGPHVETESNENANSKTAATAFIVKMLAEVRALNEAIIIADQLPTAMAPEVIKNTSLKIGHRIISSDDRALLAGTMLADNVQIERMASFTQGKALAVYEGLLKPFEIQIHQWSRIGDTVNNDLYNSPSDDELFNALNYKGSPFIADMARSMQLTFRKANARYRELCADINNFKNEAAEMLSNKHDIQEARKRDLSRVSPELRSKIYNALDSAQGSLASREYILKCKFDNLCDRLEELIFWIYAYKNQNRMFEKEIKTFALNILRAYDAFKNIISDTVNFTRSQEQDNRVKKLLAQWE